jgi:hypothetical protein
MLALLAAGSSDTVYFHVQVVSFDIFFMLYGLHTHEGIKWATYGGLAGSLFELLHKASRWYLGQPPVQFYEGYWNYCSVIILFSYRLYSLISGARDDAENTRLSLIAAHPRPLIDPDTFGSTIRIGSVRMPTVDTRWFRIGKVRVSVNENGPVFDTPPFSSALFTELCLACDLPFAIQADRSSSTGWIQAWQQRFYWSYKFTLWREIAKIARKQARDGTYHGEGPTEKHSQCILPRWEENALLQDSYLRPTIRAQREKERKLSARIGYIGLFYGYLIWPFFRVSINDPGYHFQRFSLFFEEPWVLLKDYWDAVWSLLGWRAHQARF